MKVYITAQDIQDGRRGSGARCMVAIALRRCTGREWTVGTWAASTDCGRRYCDRTHIVLPPSVEAQILRYDAGERVHPFTFDFDWWEPALLAAA